jgi:hypothetical protein
VARQSPLDPSPGPSSPADLRVAALLSLVWRYGLFPTIVAGAFLYLLYSLATGFSRAIEAIDRKVDAHQAAMDKATAAAAAADASTASAIERQGQRLKGICYGVTEEGSRARAFCDEQ